MRPRIDFNCDLGEGCDDAQVMPYITSANVACGLHAGDPATMRRTVALCLEHGVAIGAHPSFDDRAHFGRSEIACAPDEIHGIVLAQLLALAEIAGEKRAPLTHVKPHGALYNMAARDPELADAIARAACDFDPGIVLYGLSGSELTAAGERRGLRVAHEVFAERRYGADGRLVPRGEPGAVIEDLDAALDQVRRIVREGAVTAVSGETVPLRADSLCLHGDREDAAAFARAVRELLRAEGVDVAAVGASRDGAPWT